MTRNYTIPKRWGDKPCNQQISVKPHVVMNKETRNQDKLSI